MEISVYSVSRRSAFPALFPFPFRSFNGREVSSSRASSLSAGKKRNQKVGKNLILKNCHSVSIWKFQGYQLPPTSVFFTPSSAFASRISRFSSSSPPPPPHLHLYGGRLSTGCSYCLARLAANRQIRLKDIDLKSLEYARSPPTCSDQRYLLSHVVTLDHAIIKGRCYRHKSIAINIYTLPLKIQCPRPTQKYFKTRFSDVNIYCWFYLREKSMIRQLLQNSLLKYF